MSKRLLVVDDEPKLLRAVAVILRDEDFSVVTARSGAEALVRIAESLPDLVISDIRMPGMDGYQLARTLRSNPRTALIPIIFLTAKDEREDRIVGFRNGVDAYITKPFDPEELLVIINNILNRAQRISAELSRLMSSATSDNTASFNVTMDEDFTDSESRVASLVADGLSNKEIASELKISVRTVEGHISNILSKKGWSNRVEIARFMLKRDSD
ncbi:MAG TPA: response regulator transcription factor [Pyrinomonadaceae bacterium]|nr:response regulator transcription factor [Pyrinomonadaceae bacterium]